MLDELKSERKIEREIILKSKFYEEDESYKNRRKEQKP